MLEKFKSILFFTMFFSMATLLSAKEEQNKKELPPEVQKFIKENSQRYADKLMQGIRVLDGDADGAVPLRLIVSKLMERGFAKPGGEVPENVRKRGTVKRYQNSRAKADRVFIKMLKVDQEGDVKLDDIVSAVQKSLGEMVRTKLLLDIDGDGKLNLKELAIRIPAGDEEEVDSQGYTKRQRRVFAAQDLNKDGFISGKEYFALILPQIEAWVQTTQLTLLIPFADKDNDSVLSQAELVAITGEEAENLPAKVPLSESLYWIRELSAKQRSDLEKTLLAHSPKK